MPVYVESVTQPSAQDRLDLSKIYQDAPDWLLAPYADAASLIEHGIQSGQLIAGRFNDRLLGAALLQRPTDRAWQLSHLCVRRITRRRGVAQRLIDESQRYSHEAGQALHLAAPPQQSLCQQLAQHWQLPLIEL